MVLGSIARELCSIRATCNLWSKSTVSNGFCALPQRTYLTTAGRLANKVPLSFVSSRSVLSNLATSSNIRARNFITFQPFLINGISSVGHIRPNNFAFQQIAFRQLSLENALPITRSVSFPVRNSACSYHRGVRNALHLNSSPRHEHSKFRWNSSKRNLSINNLDRWQFRENSFWGEQVLYLIIGVNILVYFFWQNVRLRKFMVDNFTVSTDGVLREGRFHTLITSVFSHQGMGHLAANMVTLWFFGAEAIALLGARRFLQLYLGGGLISSMCQVAWPLIAPQLNIPARNRNSTRQLGLGASGAVNSVVALSILIAPSRTILLYFFVPVPSAVLGMLFLGKDLAGLYYGDTEFGNAAHLGGTLYGAIFWAFLRRRPFHY